MVPLKGQELRGALTIEPQDQNQLRDYLLDRLDEAQEEQVETRLLKDETYLEELNILTNELIDRYAHEAVSAEERAVLERFVLASPKRREKLKFAMALKKRSSELQERKRRTAKFLRLYGPIAAALMLVAGLGIWRQFFYTSDVDKGLSALRMAYREQRPVDARVSDFDYAPKLRGEGQNVDSLQRDRAMALLTGAAVDKPDASSEHALGQYYITQRRFDDAIQLLTSSLQKDPNNAKAESDLGVALLGRGDQAQPNNESDGGLNYFAKSLEHLEKALKLDPALLEAHFNMALVFEKLGPPERAEKAWRTYLEKDSNSKWANEARENLRALEDRRQRASAANQSRPLEDFVLAYHNRDEEAAWRVIGWNREVITGKFIPVRLVNSFLQFATNGRKEDAAQMLDALDYAGELEARKAGDMYTASVARFYRAVSQRDLATLSKAQSLAVQGFDLCRSRGFKEAVAVFAEARQTFASAGNEAESALVGYWLAYSYFHDQQIEASRSAAEDLIKYYREKNYRWLLAQALSLLSNIQTNFHEQSVVLALDQQALALSEQVNDAYGTQKFLASLAGKYSTLYNFSESLTKLARCLLLANDFWPGSRQAWRNYDTATQVFNRLGHYSASAAYGEAALRLAVESKDPSLIYVSYVHLGMAYARLDKYAEGIKHAQSGFELGKSLGDEKGKEIMAYSAFQLGELYRQKGEVKEAASNYDQAISLYDQLLFQPFKFVAHRGRLFTYLAQGNDSGAELELQTLSELFEEYRTKIKDDDNRTYFFDVAQEVYDAAIDFTHSRLHNDEAAFAQSEDSRARSLLATMFAASEPHTSDAQRPKDSFELRQRMPEQVQILFYAVLSDKTLIWVISKSQFVVREKSITGEQLNEQVQNYFELVSHLSNPDEVRRASKSLYDVLISPIEDQLVAGKTLCIVPDKILNHLPFPALTSPASGRYLIEDHALLFSPSSSVFIINTESAQQKPAPAGEKLLSVGNPTFDRSLFGSLPDLPSAAREADEVAEYYQSPAPLVLKNDRATKSAVVAAIDNADVLHFASHYVVDERWPMRSQFLLAKSTGMAHHADSSDGSLSAGDIYNMKLHRPRVAVLAACRTGVERYYNGEGMIGMARTFLAAGVPVVVASQWPVDTILTTGLMIKFHEHRRRGLSTIEALRLAQTEIIKDSSQQYQHPYYWAPFVTIGGYASF